MGFYKNKIKIGGNTYRIFEMPKVEFEGEEYLGLCDYENTDILLSNNVSEDRMKSVLYHELTHAIFYEAGYLDHEEEMITRIGIVLKQLIEDNFVDKIEVYQDNGKFFEELVNKELKRRDND